jgi:hypothetical protein
MRRLARELSIEFDSGMTEGAAGGEDIPAPHRKSYPDLFTKAHVNSGLNNLSCLPGTNLLGMFQEPASDPVG